MLDQIRKERQKWLEWKNIKPIVSLLETLPAPKEAEIKLEDVIEILPSKEYLQKNRNLIFEIAKSMMPWRKGPFKIGDLLIDSEWRSFIKYNLLLPHFDLKDKVVADIGCNNGYYLFRMLQESPKELVGFDPSPLYYLQFKFLDKFIKSGITYELLGVEHLKDYEKKFDTIFCLGVLYHRSDPINTLKSLYKGLKKNGELILDTFMIEGEAEVALTPKDRYSKIPNIYFIPTINALKNWCFRAGFKEVETLAIKKTDTTEQRKTEWITSESLENFLDPNDSSKTIEGYPAPVRLYIKAYK
jgi:tRNA (mo5U34)-methyltransferase